MRRAGERVEGLEAGQHVYDVRDLVHGFRRWTVVLVGQPSQDGLHDVTAPVVPRPHFLHHRRERLVQVDPLRVGEADHHEHDVRQLQGEGSLGLAGLLRLLAEAVIDLPGQLADLFGEACEAGKRGEVAFLILADPAIDRLLGVAKAHGIL